MFSLSLYTVSHKFTLSLTAYIQVTVALEKMERAFSVLTLISSITMLVELLLSLSIVEKVEVNVWFFISGVGMIAFTILIVIRYTTK